MSLTEMDPGGPGGPGGPGRPGPLPESESVKSLVIRRFHHCHNGSTVC